MIFYFSACGNSRFVAEELARLNNENIEQIDPYEQNPVCNLRDENESLGIVCPIYAWAVPRFIDRFVRCFDINIPPRYCYLVCTCGDAVGRAPERFAKAVKSLHLSLDAAFSLVMPETYINLKGFNLDTPENERRKIEAVRQQLPVLAERIRRCEKTYDVVRGKMPWFNTYVVNPLFYKFLITDRKFHATDACISCYRCVDVCPLVNITFEDGRPHWHGNCLNCMACYHHCPQNAIQFGKATYGKGQYTFHLNDYNVIS